MEHPSCQHIEQYLQPGKHCHLVGIGGVSMRPLGLVLRRMGMEISGSDMNASVSTDELIAKGIQVSIGHRAENIEGADCLIRTAAAHNDNPEIAAKLEADIRRDFHKLMSSQSKIAARAAGRAVDVSADDFEG